MARVRRNNHGRAEHPNASLTAKKANAPRKRDRTRPVAPRYPPSFEKQSPDVGAADTLDFEWILERVMESLEANPDFPMDRSITCREASRDDEAPAPDATTNESQTSQIMTLSLAATQPSLAPVPQPLSPLIPADGQDRFSDDLIAVLAKRFDAVYTLNADGTAFREPSLLCGVPVAPILEHSPYWDRSWSTLEALLTEEANEERLKTQAHAALQIDKTNKVAKRSYKKHQDNVSKLRKIRQIFGDNNPTIPHPNQLVAKLHMPPGGLCRKELLYRLACKLSDLEVLHSRGELSMRPFDFMRWRIARVARQAQELPGQSCSNFITSVIYSVCGGSQSGQSYSDTQMRQVILRAAELQDRLSSYGKRTRQP